MRKTWLIFSQAVTVALALWFVVATLKPEWVQHRPLSSVATGRPAPTGGTGISLAPPVAGATSYAAAARRAAPAVVSVITSKTPTRDPRANDPWFRYFFGDAEPRLVVCAPEHRDAIAATVAAGTVVETLDATGTG